MIYEKTISYEQNELLQPDYAAQEEISFQADKNGGWWITFLLGSILFGPVIVVSRTLPPFRLDDLVILLMLAIRWNKSRYLHGGFMFSYRVRLFTLFILAITLEICFSTMVSVLIGRFQFFYKDLFIPIVFIRMAIIAAIAASFVLEERQINQILKGTIILSLLSVLLAFAQKMGPLASSPLMNKLYTFEGSGQLQVQLMHETGRARVIGTFGNPNVFAGSLVMLCAILISFAINSKGFKKYSSIATFLTLVAAILFTTGSRTSIAGLFVISSCTLVLSLRKGTRLKAIIYLALFVVMVIFIQKNIEYLPVNVRLKEILQGTTGGGTLVSFHTRWAMWMKSFHQAEKSLLFGVGASKGIEQITDNGYFYTLLRIGLVGLGTYIIMTISLFVSGLRAFALSSSPLKRASLLAFTMVVVNSAVFEMTGEFFWNIRYGGMFGMIMGLLCGLSYQIKDEYQYAAYDDNDNYYLTDECESY